MQFVTEGFWKPKVYEHRGAPAYADLVGFLRTLKPLASRSTYELFLDLAKMPATDRVAKSLQTVIDLLRENPRLIENRDNTEVFARVLTAEEYASFCEIAGISQLNQAHRRTAEGLLCLRDRGTLAHFLYKLFPSLTNQPYIHPLEDV